MGRSLVFALNGERVELAAVDPRTTVLQYIRLQPSLQGTKVGCGEGGCGACTVLLCKYDATTERVEEFTINSCLAPLCSIDGCAVITTEGLKSSKNELHAVHKRLAGFHGSQCGFCTPGMSMSIYGGLRKASAKAAAAQTAVGKSAHSCSSTGAALSAVDAEKCISGNICRCTGYRPILDACKSFSGDVDVEDLGLNSFWASKHHADWALLPPYNPAKDPKFPSFLMTELELRRKDAPGLFFRHFEGREAKKERLWLSAGSLSEVLNLLEEYSAKKLDVKLVVGNTSAGVFKDMNPQVYIDISQIPELQAVRATEDNLEVGAGISLSKLISLLEEEAEKSKWENVVYTELTKHVNQIASEQVRNRASVGGNLILAQRLGFDSDLATILVGAGAEVTVASAAKGQSTLPVEEFLSQRGLETGTILVSVRIPSWKHAGRLVGAKLLFKTYRVSCRPSGNAVAYINAALLAIVDQSALVVRDLRLAFGAFGGHHAIRAGKTERFLAGKSVSPAGLLEAIKLLREEIKPPPTARKSAYRSSVAVGFFFDFFFSFSLLSPPSTDPTPVADYHEPAQNGHTSDSLTADDRASQVPALSNGSAPPPPPAVDASSLVEFGTTTAEPKLARSKRPNTSVPSSSSQKFAMCKEFWPVAQPTKKVHVALQASGEAVYVDDVTPVKGTLYAAFVLSDKQPGKIVSIDTSEALKTPGAVDFISAKDIPGTNMGFSFFFNKDRVFAEDKVECVNDPLGILVADSYEHAREAAAKVKVNVDEQVGSIYTIEDAIAKESYGDLGIWAAVASTSYGEYPVKADHRIEKGEVKSGSQYHFYMETQAAYSLPDEDVCVTVYSSNQAPNPIQKAIASCLGIPMNSVRVITRRLGGAFGGKITRASVVAVACALASYKLRKPVRMSLDRQTDMRMCAGRHEVKAVYSVDFNGDGNILGLQANVFVDGGRAKDLSATVLHGLNAGLRQYDWGSLRTENKICKTNKCSRGIMRGPGEVQGHFIAETVIEHVAAYLGINTWKVRERNMHSVESLSKFFPSTTNSVESYTMPHLWEKLKHTSQFERRQLDVKKFNEGSKWVKKGIDIVVGLYETGTLSRQARVSVFEDGSVVVEVGGIEMGQGLWTKVKQAVAYGLSKLWGPEAHPSERVDMSRIRVVQNDSLSLPNSEATAGSTGSEASCQAALMACEILVESLKPYLHKLRDSGATPAPWKAIVGMAKYGGASLTGHGNYATDITKGYVNFGACVSEVSINVLTGSTTIQQTDLLYDCGRSLNPAVDIGQVEGAFVMGVGFYLTEEWLEEKGEVMSDSTWNYKPPTADNIPERFHVELSNMKANRERILSSKASGEPPILFAKSVHSAVRQAITAAREDLAYLPEYEAKKNGCNGVAIRQKAQSYFRLDSPASIDKVKTLCGLYNVERYLASLQ